MHPTGWQPGIPPGRLRVARRAARRPGPVSPSMALVSIGPLGAWAKGRSVLAHADLGRGERGEIGPGALFKAEEGCRREPTGEQDEGQDPAAAHDLNVCAALAGVKHSCARACWAALGRPMFPTAPVLSRRLLQSMGSRPSLASVIGLALVLGGGVAGWISGESSGEDPSLGERSPPPIRVVRSAVPGPQEVETASVHQLLARRARVKRRRPRVPELYSFRPGGHRLAPFTRVPAAHEPFGEGARARVIRSDRAALNRTPCLRTARLGRGSTWCTSVPPPPALPRA